MNDIAIVTMLVVACACAGAIIGQTAPDQIRDEISASEKPYLYCVLYFCCTIVNCALRVLLRMYRLPRAAIAWLRYQRRGRQRRRATLRRPQKRQHGWKHGDAQSPKRESTAAMPQREFGVDGESTIVVWAASCILLAANPCTAVFFSQQNIA